MPSSLTPSDANVLEKIKDPESATSPVIIDETLPRDPNITDPDILATVVDKEKEIMKKVLALEQKQMSHDNDIRLQHDRDAVLAKKQFRKYMLAKQLWFIYEFDNLILKWPNYASARNNRAQLLRVVYGDEMLVKSWAETEVKLRPKERIVHPDEKPKQEDPKIVIMRHELSESFAAENTSGEDPTVDPPFFKVLDKDGGELTSATEQLPVKVLDSITSDSDFERERQRRKSLDTHTADSTLEQASLKVLSDLRRGIVLLNPKTPFGSVSPQQATLLSKLYMQRGMLYQGAAKRLSESGTIKNELTLHNGSKIHNATIRAEFRVKKGLPEASWDVSDFKHAASDNFMMAGRYGNKLGRQMAVWTNPDAKLCGEIVKEAMRKEYGLGEGEKEKGFKGIGFGFN